MNRIQHIVEHIKSTYSLDAFWQAAHNELSQFGVSGVFYGQLVSRKEIAASKHNEALPVPKGLLTRCSYSTDFLSEFGGSESLENDPTVSHCMLSDEVLVWSYNDEWAEQNPWYKKRYEVEKELGYHKGCTIPSSHFSSHWIGGMGIAMTDVPDTDFELLWRSHQREIISICGLLDCGMRKVYTEEFIGLSKRENECLTWLAAGLTPQQIADQFGISDGRVGTIIGQAKRKLGARTRDHAVARALLLGVIHP